MSETEETTATAAETEEAPAAGLAFEEFDFEADSELGFAEGDLGDLSWEGGDSPGAEEFLGADEFEISEDVQMTEFSKYYEASKTDSPVPIITLDSNDGSLVDRIEIRQETYHMSGGFINIHDPDGVYPAYLNKAEEVEIEAGFVGGYSAKVFVGKILEIIRMPPDITRVRFIDHSVALKNAKSTGTANANDGGATSSSSSGGGDAFDQALAFILEVEGGCSDHPADWGGRTYKGITTERARENGYEGDVCEMSDEMIKEIYKKDYWDSLDLDNQPPAVAFAAMNTSVNSGPGKAEEFLASMSGSSDYEKAMSIADAQEQFYLDIIARDPSQEVFREGWLNRSNNLKGQLEQFK